MSNIGLMEGAFFVGRKEIMDWINATLDVNLAKVEDTANGAIACQLLDILYPGQVPMAKINWAAKQDFEFIANYKILQTCFTKFGIDRHIDVDRLISGKYMDNLEFMQWFKRFFELTITGDMGDYDALGQRSKGKGGSTYIGNNKKGGASKPSSATSSAKSAPPRAAAPAPAPAAKPRSAPVAAPAPTPANQENAVPNQVRSTQSFVTEKSASSAEVESYKNEIAALRQELEGSRKEAEDLKQDFEGLEKERDFYFEKLRDVEVLLQEIEDKGQGNELTASIFKILYATTEGFEPATEEAVSGASQIPATPSRSLAVEGDAHLVEETY